MPSSHCKFREQERRILLKSVNKISVHSSYTYRTIWTKQLVQEMSKKMDIE